MASSASFTQSRFRFRNNDGSETGATWIDSENVSVSLSDGVFRLRIQVQEINSKGWSETWTLYASKNGGAYTQVTTASSFGLRFYSSSYLTNGDDCTHQMTDGFNSFLTDNNGVVNYPIGSSFSNTGSAGYYYEAEFSLISANNSNGDYFDFRVYRGSTALDNYANTPRLTISSGGDNLTAKDITAGIPTVDKPTIGQTHALTSKEITNGISTVDKPSLGQTYDLTAKDVMNGIPTVEKPSMATPDNLVGLDVTSGIPTIQKSIIGQTHNLGSQDVLAGFPSLDKPIIGQSHYLTASEIISGVPTVEKPLMLSTDQLEAKDITSGIPSVEKPTFGQSQLLTSQEITSGIPSVDNPILTETSELLAKDITAGISSVGQPSIGQIHQLEAQDNFAGDPTVEVPEFGQIFLLIALSILSGVPIIDRPSLIIATGNTPTSRIYVVGANDRSTGASMDDRVYDPSGSDREYRSNP